MNQKIKISALTKLAFFGTAAVSGSPTFSTPGYTVGQSMYDINSLNDMSTARRRSALGDIVNTGLPVNSPAAKLFSAGVGAITGNLVSRLMGGNKFQQGMATAAGAIRGYWR